LSAASLEIGLSLKSCSHLEGQLSIYCGLHVAKTEETTRRQKSVET